MKRLQKIIVLLALMLVFVPGAVLASDMQITIDGSHVDFAPVIVDGRSLVPVRYMADILGGDLEWNPDLRRATLIYGDTTILLYIDSHIAFVNDESTELEVPAMIINDRTHVPVRFVAESFGLDVDFYDNTIILTRAVGHLHLVSLTDEVRRGTDATLQMTGRPLTEYTASVMFRTGPSTAGGLGAATSDEDGNITWTWRVGSNTTPGAYAITVEGDDEVFVVYFTVVQ